MKSSKVIAILLVVVLILSLGIALYLSEMELQKAESNLLGVQADLHGMIQKQEEAKLTEGDYKDGHLTVTGYWLCYDQLPADGEVLPVGVVEDFFCDTTNPNLFAYEDNLYVLITSSSSDKPDRFIGKNSSNATEVIYYRVGQYFVTAPTSK